MNKIDAVSQSVTKYTRSQLLSSYIGFGGEIWGIKYRKMPRINNKYSESNGVKNRRKVCI